MDEVPGPKLMRMARAAEVIGVSRTRIYELAAAGEIPTIRIGSSLRVPVAALDRWIEERTVGGTKPAA
jgi:excisionase family DNA binding protein